jgi:hypothetical protein
MKWKWRDYIGRQVIFMYKASFYKTVRRTTIYEGRKFRYIRVQWNRNIWMEGRQIQESDSVET